MISTPIMMGSLRDASLSISEMNGTEVERFGNGSEMIGNASAATVSVQEMIVSFTERIDFASATIISVPSPIISVLEMIGDDTTQIVMGQRSAVGAAIPNDFRHGNDWGWKGNDRECAGNDVCFDATIISKAPTMF
jgi:hypothetical protein